MSHVASAYQFTFYRSEMHNAKNKALAAQPPASAVQAMFGRIAPRYDALNHLLSFGLDFFWWRKMARTAGAGSGKLILDVAAGTGDSSLALARRGASVVAADFSMQMLSLGKTKFERKGFSGSDLRAVGADAQSLPFRESIFDAVTICFGLRNVEHRAMAYSEFMRVLKPGGRLVVLEFGRPRWGWVRIIYRIYSQFLVPFLGDRISGHKDAYEYLPESIRRFPRQAELAEELKNVGFADVRWQDLSNGIVAVYCADSP
jgi:demethylmenaquinone methyltransferase/2-methoxy-6-polyprenyl-1,4-benzoquinol methylase